jgi:hypothetical protein
MWSRKSRFYYLPPKTTRFFFFISFSSTSSPSLEFWDLASFLEGLTLIVLYPHLHLHFHFHSIILQLRIDQYHNGSQNVCKNVNCEWMATTTESEVRLTYFLVVVVVLLLFLLLLLSLVVGDVEGQFETVFGRVSTVQKQNGPFHALFCVGDFFGPSEQQAQDRLQPYLQGNKESKFYFFFSFFFFSFFFFFFFSFSFPFSF